MVATRLHAPGPQVFTDVARRQTKTGTEDCPPLRLVRCDEREPLLEIVGGNGGGATRRGRRQGGQKDGEREGTRDAMATTHSSSSREASSRPYYIARLPGYATSDKVFQLDRLPACV